MAVQVPTQMATGVSAAEREWYQMPASAALAALDVGVDGLIGVQVRERLAKHGPNELTDRGAKAPLAILWEQVTSVMVLILIAAAALSLFLGKYPEAAAIFAIVTAGLAVTAQLQSLISGNLRTLGEQEGLPQLPLANVMLLRNTQHQSPITDCMADYIVEGFK